MIYYCTYTMGGTSRGVGILKALGEGVLVTPYRNIARLEELPWFRHPPLPMPDDVLIYDRIKPFRDKGKRVSIAHEGDVDLVVDWPIISHDPSTLDLEGAEYWWSAPVLVSGNLIQSVIEEPPKERILACRGGPPRRVRDFASQVGQERPNARILTSDPRQFYWPALELMLLAEDVIGERQVQNEWAVIRKEADPDGARRAAGEIRKLLGNL